MKDQIIHLIFFLKMTTTINFKEQAILTLQERSNAPFHSGCKMFTWTSNENPIRVD
jgi:hypothetical protein